ncbi:MAG: hypothetical protein ACYCVB_10985 [Bacilli bacterium]
MRFERDLLDLVFEQSDGTLLHLEFQWYQQLPHLLIKAGHPSFA